MELAKSLKFFGSIIFNVRQNLIFVYNLEFSYKITPNILHNCTKFCIYLEIRKRELKKKSVLKGNESKRNIYCSLTNAPL